MSTTKGSHVIKQFSRTLAAAALIVMCVIVNAAVRADNDEDSGKGPNRYIATNLTSDLPGAPNTDVVLQNAWEASRDRRLVDADAGRRPEFELRHALFHVRSER